MTTMTRARGARMALCAVVISIMLSSDHALGAPLAQITWSEPINLSNTPQLSTHPAIVADGHGFVHVFWSEDVGGRARETGDLGGAGNTILHTRWDGVSWTPPMDILFVPGEQIAEFVSVDVGPDNRLHVSWTGQSDLYYSSAPSWRAESAHAWREPVVVASNNARSRGESSIAVASNGDLHVVYATRGDDAGVFHIDSHDGGVTWSLDRKLSAPLGALETSYSTVQVLVDGAGYLHAVWQTNQQEGYGQAVYYARSVNGGVDWSDPWQFGHRDPGEVFVEWPHLTVRGDTEIHLVYVDGGHRGRLQRVSVDGGNTWSEARHIITELEGINGYVIPVVDGEGNMHLIANMRTRSDMRVGIYYAHWLGDRWSSVTPLDNASPAAPSAHYTAATVRLGNEIFVVYNQISVGEIWFLHGRLSSVLPQPAVATPRPEREIEATPDPGTATIVSIPVDPFPQPDLHLAPQQRAETSTWAPMALSIAASSLVTGGVLGWVQLRKRKRPQFEMGPDLV